MKFKIFILITLFNTIVSSQEVSKKNKSSIIAVVQREANIRESNSPLSRNITIVGMNDTVELVDYQDGYWKVIKVEYSGYISELFIKQTYMIKTFKIELEGQKNEVKRQEEELKRKEEERQKSIKRSKEGYILPNLLKNDQNQNINNYYDNGNLRSTGKKKDGKKIGRWKFYYENGQLNLISNFDGKGVEIKNFYPSIGTLKSIEKFDGNIVGKWIWYYDNSQIREIGEYNKNGERTGVWRLFYENGKLKQKGQVDNGNLIGKWKYYSEYGELINDKK